MKRTPLRRGTSTLKRTGFLARKTRLASRSKTSAYARRGRNKAYMAAVATLECMASEMTYSTPCSGRITVDHIGDRGKGQRSLDCETCAMCNGHHQERTDGRGTFKGWSSAGMRQWRHEAIAKTRVLLAESGHSFKPCGACQKEH